MDEEQIESLNTLKEFCDYSDSLLENAHFNKFIKNKKRLLLLMFVNACDLAGNIHILLSNERVNSANILLRSLYESWINACFIYADNTSTWLDSYRLESVQELKRFAKATRHLRAKYPRVNTSPTIFTDKKVDDYELCADKYTEYLKKGTKISFHYPMLTAGFCIKNL